MDHINSTKNFSLQHLRFLVHRISLSNPTHEIITQRRSQVIDEADRLLAQSFQDWLAQVLAATRPPKAHKHQNMTSDVNGTSSRAIPYPDGIAPAFLHLHPSLHFRTDIDEPKLSSCQKLLFSATLTRDPDKVAALELRNPKYFVVQSQDSPGETNHFAVEKFSMPATLTVSSYLGRNKHVD